ncbi:MAG: mechanosensitive ion channel family protein [Bacteroidota bacterium]
MKDKILENIEYVALFVGILIATFIIGFIVNRFFKRFIKRSTEMIDADPTNYHFLRHIITATIYVVGLGIAVYMMPGLRVLATSLLAGAGVLAVAVGFASQQALSNVISGVFIVIFKPFRLHDRLTIKGKSGVVEDIGLRHTVIRDFENKRVILPNSVVNNEVIVNADYVDERICKWIDVGIAYDSDIDKAREIMRDEILNHPLLIDHRTDEQKENGDELGVVRVIGLGDSAVSLRGWAWTQDVADAFVLGCDLLESIKKRFDQEGIEIPYPHRTMVYKGELPPSPGEAEQN